MNLASAVATAESLDTGKVSCRSILALRIPTYSRFDKTWKIDVGWSMLVVLLSLAWANFLASSLAGGRCMLAHVLPCTAQTLRVQNPLPPKDPIWLDSLF